jgi:hypothetical protein
MPAAARAKNKQYLPTGRGYKLAATSFKDLYRRFGRSHMYFGAVLLMYCVACVSAGHLQGAQLLVLWAPALVVVSLLFGPFFFTPSAFRTTVVMVRRVGVVGAGLWLGRGLRQLSNGLVSMCTLRQANPVRS